jgi:DNA-binding response OmpR family regulator
LVPHRTRVLVVDDNRDLVDTLLVLLDADGYNAKGIYSARTILADVEEFDPDVVILDLEMPGKSGWAAARDILQYRRGMQRPMLIAISGEFTKGSDRLRADLNDFDYYLIKPCDPAVLSTLVASYPNTRPKPESQVVRA